MNQIKSHNPNLKQPLNNLNNFNNKFNNNKFNNNKFNNKNNNNNNNNLNQFNLLIQLNNNLFPQAAL